MTSGHLQRPSQLTMIDSISTSAVSRLNDFTSLRCTLPRKRDEEVRLGRDSNHEEKSVKMDRFLGTFGFETGDFRNLTCVDPHAKYLHRVNDY